MSFGRRALPFVSLFVAFSAAFPVEAEDVVAYEDYGAVGDGVHDDLPAICRAHQHANAHGLPVKSNPSATYHLGSNALTAIIATDTDWSTSRFVIDDTEVENHRKPLFEVRSLLGPEKLKIDRLHRDQKQLDMRLGRDCYVAVTDHKIKRFIRRGLNQNSGTSQRDCFILHRDGSIEGDIDWDYDDVSRVEARPIDEKRLFLRGGVFTTTANRMKQEVGYNYWARNVQITRSNTEVDGLTHHVVGETSVGHPYSGFISVGSCASVTLRNCFATAHKTYRTISAVGKPVSMGSYDYTANSVVNFTMINCRMDNITDRTRWGVIGTNFCKNILLEDCTLNRMDTHMGVSGSYVIRRCKLGYMGLNAIGRGLLSVEDSTLCGRALINFRSDYGSTWDGNVVIRNCRWVPDCGRTCRPQMFGVRNDGTHDFGYDCFMPQQITIDGLYVDDSNHPEDYQGMYLFGDPGGSDPTKSPFPYTWCQKVTVGRLTTASGKMPRVSPNAQLAASVVVLLEGTTQGETSKNSERYD
ncbi:MAG: hypothetical protein H8E44_32420 [Planctomycetes bacterium]|nr:hypothetical protein [Planctomycetota bacterium]MBL7037356.1 hypothetical protein [Pirellulaceae bacterium]